MSMLGIMILRLVIYMKDQNTPLLLSSINGHTGTVVLLLERGVDIDAKDKVSWISKDAYLYAAFQLC